MLPNKILFTSLAGFLEREREKRYSVLIPDIEYNSAFCNLLLPMLTPKPQSFSRATITDLLLE